jgi:predicted dehydrogenase
MIQSKLKTAVLGLNKDGQLLLEAAQAVDYFEIEAVADTDIILAEKTSVEFQCKAYDDYRQLITAMDSHTGAEPRCLLVAAGMHSCDEYVRMAMKRKFHILKFPPPSRDFEEAAEFVRLSEDEGTKFAIANSDRFAAGSIALREFLERGKIEQIFLMTVFCSYSNQQYHNWQTDPKLAGGGVLLHNCYSIIDRIVSNFGVAQQVYSQQTNQAHDKQQRSYLVEDTTVVTLKFSDTFIANIIASRRGGLGPEQESIQLYGQDKILTINRKQLTLRDGSGEICEEVEFDDDPKTCMTELLKNFALSILQPKENQLTSSGRENLKNMAVIESAYLSARTGFPEEPTKILQMPSGVPGIQTKID